LSTNAEDLRTEYEAEHVLHLYGRESELVRSVGSYLLRALQGGEAAVVVASPARRRAIEEELMAGGLALAEARQMGRYASLDAEATLSQFVRDGCVDRGRFDEVIGSLLRRVASRWGRVWMFGEMVPRLWESDNVSAAIEVEGLLNNVLREIPSRFYCACPSQAVYELPRAEVVRHVCRLHSAVFPPERRVAVPGLEEVSREFPAEAASPREARRFLCDALRRTSLLPELVSDSALVLTELAANAMIHARSAFRVAVAWGPGVVWVSVQDASSTQPVRRGDYQMTLSGRGLSLVGALANRWGMEVLPEGKIVWAELRR
jgi:anti-sigma regulatory factor (Ser/Thr protein kinase)